MLMKITEEETHTLPGGDSYVVRSMSDHDAYGKLQLVQRQIEETKKSVGCGRDENHGDASQR
jgi:hypothetical protein